MDQNSYKFCTSFNTISKKLVRTQFSQLKISMTLPVLSYRLSSRSNHSDISLFTWTDLMRSSRFTWRGQMQNTNKIMATIPFSGRRKIYQHLWEKDIQDLAIMETLKKQAKSINKAFLQVAVVPVLFRGALNMVHH